MTRANGGAWQFAAKLAAVAVLTGIIAAGVACGGESKQAEATGTPAVSASPQPSATTPAGTASRVPSPGATASTPPGTSTTAPGATAPPSATVRPTSTPLPAGLTRITAPIDAARILVQDVAPRYLLKVTAGLPNGCAKPGGYEVSASADEVRVAVYDTMPTGDIACTQIYGDYDLEIDLGTNFVAGRQYSVDVNGTVLTFVAR